MAEKWFGVGKPWADFITVHLGAGISCGIVHVLESGKVDSTTGELGHTRSFFDERCRCGRIGCLETEVSVWAIRRYIEQYLSYFDGEFVEQLNRQTYAGIVDGYLDHALASPEGPVADHLRHMARTTGVGLRNLADLVGHSLIILHGQFTRAESIVVPEILKELHVSANPNASGPFVKMWEEKRIPEVRVSTLGEYGGALGAAGFLLAEHYQFPVPVDM